MQAASRWFYWGLLYLFLSITYSQVFPQVSSGCYMRYQHPTMLNKSIDFENPSVFELLGSNYSARQSPFFEVLHRARDCISLSYWINNEPDSVNFRGKLQFSCGVQELLAVDLVHEQPNPLTPSDFCLRMLFKGRPVELFECSMLALNHHTPIVFEAHVGSMVILTQRTSTGFDYLLFQRIVRYADMLDTIKYFEARYRITPGVLKPRAYYTSVQWLGCNCDQLKANLSKLYQCLGIPVERSVSISSFNLSDMMDDMFVVAAIGLCVGVVLFLLLKIRLIC